VAAQANQYNTKLVLKLNGQKIEAKLIGTNSYETVFAVPSLQEFDSLSLKIRGSAYIEKVSASLKSQYGGDGNDGQGGINQNGVVKAHINQTTQGVHVYKVKQLIKSQNQVRLQGMKVKKVIMKASSLRGNAKATLLINGSPAGYSQIIPMYPTRMVFELSSYSQNIIGQDVRSIQIEVRGKVTTKMVAIKVATNDHGQGGYNNNVLVDVNQTVYGSQRLSLVNLLPYGTHVDRNKKIEAITIVARGRGIINIAGAGRGQGGVQVQGPTTQSIRLSGHTTLNSLKLRIRATGNKVVIQQVRIKFKRGNY
jgi:hypothetical protein